MWPVPTWNLRTQCQSLQAASKKLPAGLSASLREGATRLAMMGDLSQSKRGDVKLKMFSPCRLNSDSKTQALHLALLPWSRLTIGRGIAQGGVTNARHLVGQRTGRLVVIGARLHRGGPGAQAIQAAPYRAGCGRGPQHRTCAMGEQHAQVAVAAFRDAAQHLAAAGTELPRRQPEPACKMPGILEVRYLTTGRPPPSPWPSRARRRESTAGSCRPDCV